MGLPTFGENESRILSRREHQVAELLAWGASKKEIPDMLVKLYGGAPISVHTVENIARNVYVKIHLNKASELSAWWFCRFFGVDSSASPFKRLRDTAIGIMLLLIMLPQTLQQDLALKPSGTRTARIERAQRRKD
ncbi:MAG: hypothetical protein K1V99_05935 [Bacteroidales bacterium]